MDNEEKRRHLREFRRRRETIKDMGNNRLRKIAEEMYAFCEQNGGHYKGLTDAYGDGNCDFCGMGMP